MSGRSFLAVTLALSLTPCALSQALNPQHASDDKPANIKLILQPEDVRDGMPQAFTFVLLNITDHNLLVPAHPSVDCGDNYDGSFWLEIRFTPWPFTPLTSEPRGGGWGCAGSVYQWPPVIERVKQWKTIAPGESFRITAPKDKLHLDGKLGKYELWARYIPPSVSPGDETILRHAGIDFPIAANRRVDLPQGQITSDHMTFVMAPKP
jgi:hypothetical protein